MTWNFVTTLGAEFMDVFRAFKFQILFHSVNLCLQNFEILDRSIHKTNLD